MGVVLPQVKEDVSLLIEHDLDVTGMYHRIVHLVPLSVAGLKMMGEKLDAQMWVFSKFQPK